MQQLAKQTELREIRNGVGHRGDPACERFEFLDRASCDAGGGRLVHGVDHHAGVIEGQDAVRLIAVGEKTARERLTDDESNHGVTSESGGAVASAAAAAAR